MLRQRLGRFGSSRGVAIDDDDLGAAGDANAMNVRGTTLRARPLEEKADATRAFEKIVPKMLPAPKLLVWISGVAEIAGGLGLLIPMTQRWAAWGLIALYVAVFPANINMAMNDLPLGRQKVPRWAQWARLPFQALFIGWAWLYT